MPQRPYSYRINSWKTFDLKDLAKTVAEQERSRQISFERASIIQARLVQIRNEMEIENSPKTGPAMDNLEKELLEICDVDRRVREGNISGVVEEFLRAKSFWYFICNGSLMPQSVVDHFATDEEYLAGACMRMCQDLARYSMGRAIERDIDSIRIARDLTSDLLQHLLDYDFSNPYLLRRLDDTENALKTMETIMQEVHLTSSNGDLLGPVKKRAKVDSLVNFEPTYWSDLFKRMESRQDMREKLNKKCKHVKKASRKALFLLHKGDAGRAYNQLAECEKYIERDMWPIVRREPPLEAGPFSKIMKDYATAKIFYAWMWGKEETPEDTESVLLRPADFPVEINEAQYLMGLINVTPEITRSAMLARTERNFEKVKHCLATCAAIANAVLSMERCPVRVGGYFSKLKDSVGFLERALYEMSLSTAAGGQKIISGTSITTSSSLVPNLPMLRGSKGSSAFGFGASAPETVPIKAGSSNFPGLEKGRSNNTKDIEDDHRSTSSGDADSKEMEDSSSSSSNNHNHNKSRKRQIGAVVKDVIEGTSIPMTLHVKGDHGVTENVSVSLSVTGEGDHKKLTLTQTDSKPNGLK